jgi:hypothetical protein
MRRRTEVEAFLEDEVEPEATARRARVRG